MNLGNLYTKPHLYRNLKYLTQKASRRIYYFATVLRRIGNFGGDLFFLLGVPIFFAPLMLQQLALNSSGCVMIYHINCFPNTPFQFSFLKKKCCQAGSFDPIDCLFLFLCVVKIWGMVIGAFKTARLLCCPYHLWSYGGLALVQWTFSGFLRWGFDALEYLLI